MSFDEQLRQAFDALTDRLRDDLAAAVGGVADELTVAAHADRERAAGEAAADARADADREAAARIADCEIAARENRRAAELAASERLLRAIRDIDRATSLTEILDTLVGAAGREAARAGILIVRGSSLAGWRFVDGTGAGAGFDTSLALDLFSEPTAFGVVGEAVRTGIAASSDTAGGLSQPPFGLPDGRERVALPIPMNGRVVAVLYADQGAADDPSRDVAIAWPSILEVLTRHAARSLEALTAFRAAGVVAERPDASLAERPNDQETGARQ